MADPARKRQRDRARAARRRARERAGLIVLRVEVNEVDLVENLVAAGFLPSADADDRAMIQKAFQFIATLWTKPVTRDGGDF